MSQQPNDNMVFTETESTMERDSAVDADEQYFDKDRWDEGGISDCGYSESIHATLMTLGGCMYGIFGDPSEGLSHRMKGIGSYFQEASYAVRDFRRGTLERKEFKFQTDDVESNDSSDAEEK